MYDAMLSFSVLRPCERIVVCCMVMLPPVNRRPTGLRSSLMAPSDVQTHPPSRRLCPTLRPRGPVCAGGGMFRHTSLAPRSCSHALGRPMVPRSHAKGMGTGLAVGVTTCQWLPTRAWPTGAKNEGNIDINSASIEHRSRPGLQRGMHRNAAHSAFQSRGHASAGARALRGAGG